jgi:hypothetical protein
MLWKDVFLFIPHSKYMVLAHVYFLSLIKMLDRDQELKKFLIGLRDRFTYIVRNSFNASEGRPGCWWITPIILAS